MSTPAPIQVPVLALVSLAYGKVVQIRQRLMGLSALDGVERMIAVNSLSAAAHDLHSNLHDIETALAGGLPERFRGEDECLAEKRRRRKVTPEHAIKLRANLVKARAALAAKRRARS